MAQVLNIHADLGLVCFRFADVIRIPDVREAFLAWVARPDFDPGFVMFIDARQVRTVEATFLGILAEVQTLKAQLQKFDATGGLLVGIVETETVFGMARILEQVLDYTSKVKMVTVWTADEAMRLAGHDGRDLDEIYSA